MFAHSIAQNVEHRMWSTEWSACASFMHYPWSGLLETCLGHKHRFNATYEKGLQARCTRRGMQECGLKKQGSTCSPELNLPLKLRPAFKAASTSFKHFSMVSSSLRAAVSLPLGPPRMALTCTQAVQAVLSNPHLTPLYTCCGCESGSKLEAHA